VSILDQIEKFWSDLLGFMSTLVIPDWAGLIALMPVFIVLGIVGPLLTLGVLAWLGYGVTKPRVKVRYDYGTRRAPLDYLDRPIFPAGEPYCPDDGLIYASGTTRCDVDGTQLSIRCPKCEIVQPATNQSCSNCGLVLKIQPRAMVIAGDRPPPGGAAIA
jgi:hypothetical protein